MQIQEVTDNYGNKFEVLRAGLVKGRNYLIGQGYTKCTNGRYVESVTTIAHYNKITGYWLFKAK